MEKYRIQNLDCAACAAKIENALNRTQGVQSASVDFATGRLHISAAPDVDVPEVVRKADPEVQVVKDSQHAAAMDDNTEGGFHARRSLLVLLVCALLFAVVLALDYGGPVDFPDAVFAAFAVAVYIAAGFSVIVAAAKTVIRRDFFDENVLMVIATLGAIAIGAYSEAVAVMVFYKTGEFLQNLAVHRSRRSIRGLLAQKPDFANLVSDSGTVRTSPESVRAGDTILVKPGEKIPLDGTVTTGRSMVDASVLTGESMPRSIAPEDDVHAGEVNMSGVLTISVLRPFSLSTIARMLELVENASARKSKTENFITVFARYYTPAMVMLAACVAFLPPLLIAEAEFGQWIYRALVLLVISCPCALVISIPLGYFGGIGRASKSGILVKGSNFLDALAHVHTVVFDKTGTLTEGVFTLRKVVPQNGLEPDNLLGYAAAALGNSTHPVARSVTAAFERTDSPSAPFSDGTSEDAWEEISGMGVKAFVAGKVVAAGNERLMEQENITYRALDIDENQGNTTVHVAIDGVYAGYILVGDRIRPDAAAAIARLRENGVRRVVMLTGDNRNAAQRVASKLDIDEYHAGLLPEDKVRILEDLMQEEKAEKKGAGKIAFVGDGINDSPVIARADVGVAMGALGSDAAIETADVVLMTDSPDRMAEAVSIGRRTRVIVWQNIVLALSVKLIVIGFGAFGLATMWMAVFADVGTALLAVANSTRMLAGKQKAPAGRDTKESLVPRHAA